MIYAVLCEAVVIATLLCILVSFERANRRERDVRAAAYERTLQTMADRIQRPDRLPVLDRPEFAIPEREPDEWNTVGQVNIDPDYGLTDDES